MSNSNKNWHIISARPELYVAALVISSMQSPTDNVMCILMMRHILLLHVDAIFVLYKYKYYKSYKSKSRIQYYPRIHFLESPEWLHHKTISTLRWFSLCFDAMRNGMQNERPNVMKRALFIRSIRLWRTILQSLEFISKAQRWSVIETCECG